MTDAPLHDPIDALLDVLDLTWEGSTTIRAAASEGLAVDLGASEGDIFLGQSQRQAHGRVFGGQVLAQAVIAAGRTVGTAQDGTDATAQERHIHSLHAYFLRPGDDRRPIQFVVERMRDGRSFSARRVHALQEGRILLSLTASFQEPAGGMEHHLPMPEVPGPEGLRSDRDILGRIDHPGGPAQRPHPRAGPASRGAAAARPGRARPR
ncbi:acyl-CoA thioesterase [Ornithinimicrobium sp. W1665]|uniref:acyl-CoA thioesterase n=1 Tax=Ornithinimicrobium sp. W1665 TaxID=3416666 RepID=UPI003D6B388D